MQRTDDEERLHRLGRISRHHQKKLKESEWAFDRIKEAFEKVAQDEAEKVSIVQEIVLEVQTTCRQSFAPVGGQGGVTMSYLCPHFNSFPLEDYGWWVLGRKTTKWWCAICGEKYDWKQPHSLLVVQTGDSVEQAKVFKAHAVPQGLCANLINELKLLENQQEDGDGLLQNVVKDLGKESRKGLTDGLRDFIKVDNERARDVGSPRRGTGTFKVRKPKVPEGCSDVKVRESRTSSFLVPCDKLAIVLSLLHASRARSCLSSKSDSGGVAMLSAES